MEYMESQIQNLFESSESERDRCYTKIAELEAQLKASVDTAEELLSCICSCLGFESGNYQSWPLMFDAIAYEIDKKDAHIEHYVSSVEMVKNYPEACVVENKDFVMMSPVAHRELLAKIKGQSVTFEAQLKTAKRDGIIDFAKSPEFTEIFGDRFSASHAAIAAYRYANSLTGEE